MFSEATAGLNVKSKQWQALESKRQQAQATVAETNGEWQQLHLRVHMLTACAVVSLQLLPDKLNPVVRPLMEAIKREENTLVQAYAASFVARLLQQCCGRSPCPNPKIVKNLCASACVDASTTPSSSCPVPPTQETVKGLFTNVVTSVSPDRSIDLMWLPVFPTLSGGGSEKDAMHHMVNKTRGIIILYRHQKAAFAITSKRGPAPKAPKAPNADLPPGSILGADSDEVQESANTIGYGPNVPLTSVYLFAQSKKPFLIQRRGAELSLTTVARHFGADLTRSLPYLWENTIGPLRAVVTEKQCVGMSSPVQDLFSLSVETSLLMVTF